MTLFAQRIRGSVPYIWSVVGRNSEQIKISSGIFVALFVLWEYNDAQKDERIARALSYVTEYQSQQKMDARIDSRLVWQENPEDMSILPDLYEAYIQNLEAASREGRAAVSTSASKQAQASSPERAVLDIIYNLVKSHERFENKLHGLHNFYYSVAQCTLSEVCDARTICQTFFGDVQTFRAVYLRYFDEWSNNWSENKGVIIDKFVEFCDDRSYHFAYID